MNKVFIVVGSVPFEMIYYDSDAVAEYASPWEWGEVVACEFCLVFGWTSIGHTM